MHRTLGAAPQRYEFFGGQWWCRQALCHPACHNQTDPLPAGQMVAEKWITHGGLPKDRRNGPSAGCALRPSYFLDAIGRLWHPLRLFKDKWSKEELSLSETQSG